MRVKYLFQCQDCGNFLYLPTKRYNCDSCGSENVSNKPYFKEAEYLPNINRNKYEEVEK